LYNRMIDKNIDHANKEIKAKLATEAYYNIGEE
jgi:hypothetical protein